MEDQSKQDFPDEMKTASPDMEDVPKLSGAEATAPTPSAEPPLAPTDLALKKLRVKFDKQSERAKELKEIVEQAQAELKVITQEMTTVAHLFQKPEDPKQNQKNIMAYIQTQNRLRKEKAEARRKVLGNLKLEEVLPAGSKLDQAMARKKGLGTTRPAPRPLMTNQPS